MEFIHSSHPFCVFEVFSVYSAPCPDYQEAECFPITHFRAFSPLFWRAKRKLHNFYLHKRPNNGKSLEVFHYKIDFFALSLGLVNGVCFHAFHRESWLTLSWMFFGWIPRHRVFLSCFVKAFTVARFVKNDYEGGPRWHLTLWFGGISCGTLHLKDCQSSN